MKVVMFAHAGSGNHGCEAIVRSTCDILGDNDYHLESSGWEEDQKFGLDKLVKPIIFIIVTSLIYTLLNHFFHIEDGYVNYHEAKKSTTGSIVKWMQDHYGYANIMMGVFIALWIKLFFKKYNYNFYEILIMLCFVMGMGMLIFSVFVLIEGLTHFHVMTIAGIIGIAYCIWAIGHFFDKKKAGSYVKALAAYILGMITFWVLPVIFGTLIDILSKH
jgi:hypothetical protein